MSETDINDAPPIGVLVPGDHGLTAWTPQYVAIEVRLVPVQKVMVRAYRGSEEVVFSLDAVQAKHLSDLLSTAAEKVLLRSKAIESG